MQLDPVLLRKTAAFSALSEEICPFSIKVANVFCLVAEVF